MFGGGATLSGGTLSASNVVDIYDSATNAWTTAQLSVARGDFAATSVGTKAMFGGGYNISSLDSNVVDIYDSSTPSPSPSPSPSPGPQCSCTCCSGINCNPSLQGTISVSQCSDCTTNV